MKNDAFSAESDQKTASSDYQSSKCSPCPFLWPHTLCHTHTHVHTHMVRTPLIMAESLVATWSRKERHVRVCVRGQHVQLQRLCVNEQHCVFSHYHSGPLSPSLTFSSPSIAVWTPHPPHSPTPPLPSIKACFPTIVGAGAAVSRGWGAGWERPSRLDMSRCLGH